jgi:hypothetical protein
VATRNVTHAYADEYLIPPNPPFGKRGACVPLRIGAES